MVLFCLLSAAPGFAQLAYDEPRPLSNALARFAEETGVNILYSSPELSGLIASPVPAGLSPRATLEALLAGSGAGYVLTPSGVFVVTPHFSFRARQLASEAAGLALLPDAPDVMVITARRREETLAATPIAVTAFSGREIGDMGALEIADFLQYAPGVSVNSDTAFQQLAIRGVGTALGGNANSYYLDNVPFSGVTVPWNPNVQTFDLDRVEVLRGPQGTLFGEGSMGGTVRILSNAPDAQAYAGNLQTWGMATRGGSISNGFRSMLNLPIAENRLALRLVAIDEHRAGWVDTDTASNANDVDAQTYRARLRYTPLETLTFDLSAWSNDQQNLGSSQATAYGVTEAALPIEQGYDQYAFSVSQALGALNISYSIGSNDFGYIRNDVLSSGSPYALRIGLDMLTQEALVSRTSVNGVSWTAGYYYRLSNRDEALDIQDDATSSVGTFEQREHAVFADLSWPLAEHWDLSTGVRFLTARHQRDETATMNGYSVDAEVSEKSNAVLPRVILSYAPAENRLFYASLAQGARGAQVQPRLSAAVADDLGVDLPDVLRPDRITTYELGTKIYFDAGRTQLEGAIYHSIWSDAPQRVQLTDSINGLMNADEILSSGVEVSLARSLNEYITANAAASYTHARFTHGLDGSQIKAGDAPEMVPEWTASASLDYLRPLNSRLFVTARLDISYTGSRSNPAYSYFEASDQVVLMNARLGLQSQHYGAQILLRNLTDDGDAQYTVSTITGEAVRARPISVGIELSSRF